MDKIIVSRLECFGRHGVLAEENSLGQKFIVSAELFLDLSRAGKTDDLKKSVNYAEVCRLITDFMKNNVYKLIETAAERLAELLLVTYDISSVKIRLEKPWAPIGLPLEYAGVQVERRWHRAYIAFGSNMGDRKMYVEKMLEALKTEKRFRLKKVSQIIETQPYGYVDQDPFLNGCLEAETLFSPHDLLDFLHTVENMANRRREIHWGPRTLDLDILLYDSSIIYDEILAVPHIDMENREFVLKPLAQIAPYAINPLNGKTVKKMYEELLERLGK